MRKRTHQKFVENTFGSLQSGMRLVAIQCDNCNRGICLVNFVNGCDQKKIIRKILNQEND